MFLRRHEQRLGRERTAADLCARTARLAASADSAGHRCPAGDRQWIPEGRRDPRTRPRASERRQSKTGNYGGGVHRLRLKTGNFAVGGVHRGFRRGPITPGPCWPGSRTFLGDIPGSLDKGPSPSRDSPATVHALPSRSAEPRKELPIASVLVVGFTPSCHSGPNLDDSARRFCPHLALWVTALRSGKVCVTNDGDRRLRPQRRRPTERAFQASLNLSRLTLRPTGATPALRVSVGRRTTAALPTPKLDPQALWPAILLATGVVRVHASLGKERTLG